MRDPLLRRASAGLILALPALIYFASNGGALPAASGAAAIVAAEAVLASGLWFAARSRRLLRESAALETAGVGLVTPAFRSPIGAGPLAG